MKCQFYANFSQNRDEMDFIDFEQILLEIEQNKLKIS